MITMSGNKSYQADCFTPKKTLRRSPSSSSHKQISNTENDFPVAQTRISSKTNLSSSLSYDMGDGVLREVQDACFTPRKSLQRSPPTNSRERYTNAASMYEREIDIVPPPTKFEIPRTPVGVQTVQYQQYQVLSPSDRLNCKKSPHRVKTPTHPLSKSAKADSNTPHRKPISVSNYKSLKSPTVTLAESLPIIAAASPDVPKLPGLKCTENDLAYLQHMKNIKQLTKLRAEAGELNKIHKKATEEKELLEHESQKIDKDVERMKSKVQSITSTVHQLVGTESGGEGGSVLRQSEVEQLRRLNQRTAAELERAERERKGELAKVSKAAAKLNKDIEILELKQKTQKSTLEAKLASTQRDLSSIETKTQELSTEHQNTKDELEILQTELARMSVSKKEDTSRKQLEENLRNLIRRCDLYVKRHNVLKEMGI